MNPARWLKSVLRRTLPLSLQLRLRRCILARRVAREAASPDARARCLRAIVGTGDVVFDIGANAGEFAAALSVIVGPSGTVCAFEPIRETYDVLVEVIRRARLRNVRAYCLGLGERSGPADFIIPERPAFAGYYQAHLATREERGRRVCVEMGVVDELIASGATPTPSFLKVDVEGHELAVLRGAATLIASRHPNWLLEVCSDTADDVFTFLQERGYAAWHWEARAFRSVSRFEVGAEPDYLFVHPASARQLEVGTGTGASLAASRRSVSR